MKRISSVSWGILAGLLINGAAVSLATASNLKAPKPQLILGNDHPDFVFSGRCENGEIYRLYAYDKNVDGQISSMYDYEGPAGKGTVTSDASPKTMAQRVCRKLAEIANGI
jgi:hypothetical protein